MKILIGGDLVPTESNKDWFESGDIKSLLGQELITLLSDADYRIFNLEVPLTDMVAPIEKCGPNLIAPTATVAGIKAIGANLVTLANNHIMDQGAQGLFSTIQTLQKNEIAYVGAGENLQVAQKPFILEQSGCKIGVYACAEHEFSIADTDRPGANPFDPLESLDHIAELKQQTDYVIVLYHGGKEHYRYPSPNLQKVCRKLVEKGADLVVCQHSHCIGCEEKWQNGTIVYGQGNFLFDHSKSEFWKTSLLIEMSVEDGVMLTYYPLKKRENTVRFAQREEAEEILSAFCARSAEIQEDGFVENSFAKLAQAVNTHYISYMNPNTTKNICFKILNKISNGILLQKYAQRKINGRTMVPLRNFVECETHRELLVHILRKGSDQI